MASNTTIDHDEIRKWAESRGGKPAAVDRTHQGGDVGIIRLMFPDNPQSEHGALVEISWDEFFDQFEAGKLALVYEEGNQFNKLVGRDTLDAREHGEHTNRRHLREEGKSAQTSRAKSGQHEEAEDEKPKHQTKAKGGKAEEREPSRGSGGKEGSELQSREYRDEQGNVHHHTKAYMEQHGGGKK